MPGTILGARDTAVNKTGTVSLLINLHSSVGEQQPMPGRGKCYGKESRVRSGFDVRRVGISDGVINEMIFEQGPK